MKRSLIAKYSYYLAASRSDNNAIVFLYDNGASLIAKVEFIPDTEPVPPAVETDGKYVLYYPRAALPEVIDLLRNESPVYVTWVDSANATLSTGYEPVGEGERTLVMP